MCTLGQHPSVTFIFYSFTYFLSGDDGVDLSKTFMFTEMSVNRHSLWKKRKTTQIAHVELFGDSSDDDLVPL